MPIFVSGWALDYSLNISGADGESSRILRFRDMGKLFGTDGIRGIANQYPITPQIGVKFGQALVLFCRRRGVSTSIVIGRDTRESGEMLDYAVVSGILSAGGKVTRVGVLPTPGVAFLTRELGSGAGVVLSASHNPREYNGFKVFSHQGYKLSDAEELEIETTILDESVPSPVEDIGKIEFVDDAGERYLSFLIKKVPREYRLDDMTIVMDCANGATSAVAPPLFKRLCPNIVEMFVERDGKNINSGCGSQYPEALSREVVDRGADVGFAFDGDGDRLVAVDEKGGVLSGDQLLMIYAKMLLDRGDLSGNIIVSTVMSNMGLRWGLKGLGLEHIAAPVGDRHVMEAIRKFNSSLGGEDSGHIIFSRHHTTGDGILAALQLLAAMKTFDRPLSSLSSLMTVFPQTLVNVPVRKKPDIKDVPELSEAIIEAERELGEEGRVLVRYSGTEPICRVMLEGKDSDKIKRHSLCIVDVIKKQLS